jgi:hypothetical protein
MEKTGIFWLFDTRVPGIADRLRRQRAAWGESAEIETLDEHHLVLIVRPGAARKLPT